MINYLCKIINRNPELILEKIPKRGNQEQKVVDVPRFELGASSMPRKRASKLRHTPSEITTCDGHLRRTEQATA